MQKFIKNNKIDICLAVISMALYAINKNGFFYAIHPQGHNDFVDIILKNHFNDFSAGVLMCSYTHVILCLAKDKKYAEYFERFNYLMLFILGCGVFWEYTPAFIKDNAVADILDIVAYVIGAITYWVIITLKGKR